MENYIFINDSQSRTGKIATERSRKAIRSQAMRKHWSKKLNTEPSDTPLSLGPPSTYPEEDGCQQDPRHHSTPFIKPAGIQRGSLSSACEGDSARNSIASPSRLLNRESDAFVYAGSSIDTLSYRYFKHYADECSSSSLTCQSMPLTLRCKSSYAPL